MNHNKAMAFPIRNLSDRGVGFASWIRKRFISNIDLSQSNEAICESINRINDVNWMRNPPILIRDQAIKNLKKMAEAEKNEIPTQFHHIDEQCMVDFINEKKRNYQVCEFIHEPDTTYEDRSSAQQDTTSEASSSTSFQTTNTSLKPIESQRKRIS
jgi:hypothetical protein